MKQEIFKFECNNEEFDATYWWGCYATDEATKVCYEYEVYIDASKHTALLVDDEGKVLTTTPLTSHDIELLSIDGEHNMDDVFDHILERFEFNLDKMGLNYILVDLD